MLWDCRISGLHSITIFFSCCIAGCVERSSFPDCERSYSGFSSRHHELRITCAPNVSNQGKLNRTTSTLGFLARRANSMMFFAGPLTFVDSISASTRIASRAHTPTAEGIRQNIVARMSPIPYSYDRRHKGCGFGTCDRTLQCPEPATRSCRRFFGRRPRPACSFRLLCFGPLRLFAKNQNRLTERRRFFLNATRIGEQQISPPHHVHKGQRSPEVRSDGYCGSAAQGAGEPAQTHSDSDEPDKRPGHPQIGELHQYAEQMRANAFSEAFAAMRGYQQQFLRGVEELPVMRGKASIRKTVTHIQHRINTGVSSHMNDDRFSRDHRADSALRQPSRQNEPRRPDPPVPDSSLPGTAGACRRSEIPLQRDQPEYWRKILPALRRASLLCRPARG